MAVLVDTANSLHAGPQARIKISVKAYLSLARQVDAAFDGRKTRRKEEISYSMADQERLEVMPCKLLAAHFADAIDLHALIRRIDRIRTGRAEANQTLAERPTGAQHAHTPSNIANRSLAIQALNLRGDIIDDGERRLVSPKHLSRSSTGAY